MNTALLIDVIPNTNPPRFRWKNILDTPVGKQTVDGEGLFPPSIEAAVLALINAYKLLLAENAVIRGKMMEQADLLKKQAAIGTAKKDVADPKQVMADKLETAAKNK